MRRPLPSRPSIRCVLLALAALGLTACGGRPGITVERVLATSALEFDQDSGRPWGWSEPFTAADAIGFGVDSFVLDGETWQRLSSGGWRITRDGQRAPVIVHVAYPIGVLAVTERTTMTVEERASGTITARGVVDSAWPRPLEFLGKAVRLAPSAGVPPETETLTVAPERTAISAADYDRHHRPEVPGSQPPRLEGCDAGVRWIDGDPPRLHTSSWDYAPADRLQSVSCDGTTLVLLQASDADVLVTVLERDGRLRAQRLVTLDPAGAFGDASRGADHVRIVDDRLGFDAYQRIRDDAGRPFHFRSHVTLDLAAPPAARSD